MEVRVRAGVGRQDMRPHEERWPQRVPGMQQHRQTQEADMALAS
jgi:hypothetical protein